MPSDLDDLDKELAQMEAGDGRPVRSGASSSGLKIIPITIASVAVIGFGAVVWYAYSEGVRSGSEDAAPLLRPEGPAKVQPDDPGGLEIPHQDKLVYNAVNQDTDDTKVERLIPPPEDPMTLPAEPEPAAADANTEDKTPAIPSITSSRSDDETGPKALSPPPVPETALEEPSAPPTTSTVTQSVAKETEQEVEARSETAGQDGQTAQTAAVVKDAVKPAPKPKPKPDAKASGNTGETLNGTWRIQIGALGSEDAARSEWAKRQKQLPDLLSKLSLQIQEIERNGKKLYRVRGGPLGSRKAAGDLCDQLKAQKLACLVVKP